MDKHPSLSQSQIHPIHPRVQARGQQTRAKGRECGHGRKSTSTGPRAVAVLDSGKDLLEEAAATALPHCVSISVSGRAGSISGKAGAGAVLAV